MSDFLTEKRREIDTRLRELRPLIDEYRRLEEAAAALDGVGGRPRQATRGRPAAARRPTGTRRRGRPRGSGTRGRQAHELVKAKPGITIPELAKQMNIKANYLYRVLPGLQKEGKVKKKGRGWHPA